MAVLSCPAAGQAACRPLGHECSLGRRELQLSFVQEPCPHTLFCVLFASAEPGLLGVVDKEKEMNNLYFTFAQRLPTGLLSRKNIPGLQSQRESMCQVQPIVPSSHWDITQTDISGCGLRFFFFFLFQSLEKGMLSIIHGQNLPFLVLSCCQNDPEGG